MKTMNDQCQCAALADEPHRPGCPLCDTTYPTEVARLVATSNWDERHARRTLDGSDESLRREIDRLRADNEALRTALYYGR
jgi:hypothetical protein